MLQGGGMAVTIAAHVVGRVSGAHISPAVTSGLAAAGKFAWREIPAYIAAQLLGAFLGAVLLWLAYLAQWPGSENQTSKLAAFSTVPPVRRVPLNFVTEATGTFALVLGVLAIGANNTPMHCGLTPLLVGFPVWSIGLSLGGPTGYAINPARDFGPRVAHATPSLPGREFGLGVFVHPVVGPGAGGVVGAIVYIGFFGT